MKFTIVIGYIIKLIGKRVALISSLFILASMFACTVVAQDTVKPLTSDTVFSFKEKIYKVGIPNVPGLMYMNNSGEVYGFPLELLQYMLQKNKIKYVWVHGKWNELLDKLKTGEIDLLPSTQITKEREKYADFLPIPLFTQWSELYINKKSYFNDITDLYQQKIGLVQGDNNAQGFIDYFSKFKIEYTAVYFDSHKEAFAALNNEEIFALAGPSPNFSGIKRINIKSAGIFYNPVDVSIAFTKGANKELVKLLSSYLFELKSKQNSVFYQLFNKYDLTNYRDRKWKFPFWLIYTFLIGLALIALALIFISLLKKEVSKKTKKLLEREGLLREAMKIGEIGAWSYNYRKKELFWSDEIYLMVGISIKNKKLTLNDLQKYIHPDDITKVILSKEQTLKKVKTFESEYRIVKENNEILYVKQIGILDKAKNGALNSFYGLIQNITKQKQYEQELINAKEKAERSEKLKSAFLANMSHEIRTPLNSITGFSSLLAQEDLNRTDKTKFANIILKQNDLLLSLINDILDLSKIESGNMEIHFSSINLLKLLDEIYENFKHQCVKEIELTKQFDKNAIVYVLADYTRLNQILSNFVSNAIKYTKKGKIEIACQLTSNEKHVKLCVKDTGIGMSEAESKKVFTPFVQIDSMTQGTGLGLSIAKSLADLMHIEIGVESKKDIGSEFYVIIPLDKEKSDNDYI